MTAQQTPTSQAIEKADNSPRALVQQYQSSFTAVLPSHIQKPETWIRLAQGALKKGRRGNDGRTDLEVAATNNPAAFLAALLDCARLGLEPGTEQYYLTPRKVKGRIEILGIVGYQGLIELMYRAGAISSVVAEVVYSHDVFSFRPGVDEVPVHEIDWDSDDRGELRLVYAFARMKDGATSKVVVLNRAAINTIKKSSQGADSDYSPWRTNEPAMWLKSAVRQLAKWVPTSSEYIREQLRAARDVAEEERAAEPNLGLPHLDDDHDARGMGDIIDAEVVHDDHDPDDDGGGGAPVDEPDAHGPAADDDVVDAELVPAAAGEDGQASATDKPMSIAQRIGALCDTHSIDKAAFVGHVVDGKTAPSKLTDSEAADVLGLLEDIDSGAARWVPNSTKGPHIEYQAGGPLAAVDLDDPASWNREAWLAHAERAGVKQAALLRQARTIAEGLDVPPPLGVDEIPATVAGRLADWLRQAVAS